MLLFTSNITDASAGVSTPTVTYTEISYINNDYYIETIIEEYPISTYATTHSKTAAKTYNIRNSNNVIVATFKVTGTFTYDGSTSKCTASSYSSTIIDSTWAFTYRNSSRLTNRAIGHYIIEFTQSGTVVQSLSDSVIITCAPDGTIS